MPMQLRGAAFTHMLNGVPIDSENFEKYKNDIAKEILELADIKFPVKYGIFAYELGKSGKTPHFQGALFFKKRVSFKKLGSAMKWHIESAIGTAEQNRTYCTKEKREYYEIGTLVPDKKKFGAAEALLAAREDRMEDIESQAPQLYLQHLPRLQQVRLEHFRPSNKFRKGLWLFGEPRTFKSLFAQRFTPDNWYIKRPGKYWPGYIEDTQTVVVNDIDHSNAAASAYMLKILADPYPICVEPKYSDKYIDPDTIIVTSNYSIDHLYHNLALQKALKERYKPIRVLEGRINPLGQVELLTFGNEYGVRNEIWVNQDTIWGDNV